MMSGAISGLRVVCFKTFTKPNFQECCSSLEKGKAKSPSFEV